MAIIVSDGRNLNAASGFRFDKPYYVDYHDTEWGVPVHDDRLLFEFLILEGAQAGLSWSTILKKRENYRERVRRFDPAKVARSLRRATQKLLADAGIVRNRLKIAAAVRNARAFLAVQEEFGSFDAYVWRFVGGTPMRMPGRPAKDVPATHRRVRRDEQGPEEARLQLRRQDDLLRLHAGRRHGERSHHRLLSLRPHVNLDPWRGGVKFGALHVTRHP